MKPLVLIHHKSNTQAALSQAEIIAKKAGTGLHLLYVGANEEDRDVAQAELEQAKKDLNGIKVSSELVIGDVIEELCRVVDSNAIDLVILGEDKKGGLLGISLDPMVKNVVANCPVPVIEVEERCEKMERILICTGGTQRANYAIEVGARFSNSIGCQVTLLYVTGTIASMYTGLDKMDETLAEILETDTPLSQHLHHAAEVMEGYQLKAKIELRHGSPSDAIITSAESGDYDLIVMGASRAGKNLRNWLLGNVSKEVIERTKIPVMVVQIGQSIS